MSCENVVINGIEYQPVTKSGGRKIFVLDRGFVYTGYLSGIDGDNLRIHNARCIRVWGTTGGLAQLATEGPQSATKLDGVITLLVPNRAVIHVIDCEENEKWNK